MPKTAPLRRVASMTIEAAEPIVTASEEPRVGKAPGGGNAGPNEALRRRGVGIVAVQQSSDDCRFGDHAWRPRVCVKVQEVSACLSGVPRGRASTSEGPPISDRGSLGSLRR